MILNEEKGRWLYLAVKNYMLYYIGKPKKIWEIFIA